MIETTHIYGLNVERGLNYPAEGYKVVKNNEMKGLYFFVPYYKKISEDLK